MGPPEEHREVPTKAKHPNARWRGRQRGESQSSQWSSYRSGMNEPDLRVSWGQTSNAGRLRPETRRRGRPRDKDAGGRQGGEVGWGGSRSPLLRRKCLGTRWRCSWWLHSPARALNATQVHPAKWLILCFTKFTATRENYVEFSGKASGGKMRTQRKERKSHEIRLWACTH